MTSPQDWNGDVDSPKPYLADWHKAQLDASGIPLEHAEARGYETITDKGRLAVLGIAKAARDCVPGLLIPLLDVRGRVWGYQYRPDVPRTRDGKPVKYETPWRQRNGLDIPPGIEEIVGDPGVPLWVTEGSKKADCGAQYQLCVVSLSGVWNWRGTNDLGGKTAIADWNDVALQGRRVILAFGGDVARNPKVAKALCALADYLEFRAASVEYLHLPDTDEKTGLDDYLVAGHTAIDLYQLVKPTQPPLRRAVAPGSQPDWPAPGDAYAVAQRVIELNEEPLRFWNGAWFSWIGKHYQQVSADDLRDDLYPVLADAHYIDGQGHRVKWNPNPRKLNDTIDAIRGLVKLPASTRAGSWLDELSDDDELVIPCANGLLRVSDRKLLKHTPDYFGLFVLPYDYDKNASCPRWLHFLHEVFGNDTESVELLQEWFFYVLSGRTDLHTMLMWIGPKRGGKGTVARLMKSLLGVAAYGTLNVGQLGGRFLLQDKIDKSLVVFPDEHQVCAAEGKRLVQFILETTGEDDVHVDIKNRTPWNGRLAIRLMYMGNEMPVLPDVSGAVLTRLKVLNSSVSFAGQEDRKLEKTLVGELPGILNWALDGGSRLSSRGEFVQPRSGADLLGDIDVFSNPIRSFLADHCVLANGQKVLTQELWREFDRWCRDDDMAPHRNSTWFGRQLRAAVADLAPGVTFKRQQSSLKDGRRWYYHGIGLRPTSGLKIGP